MVIKKGWIIVLLLFVSLIIYSSVTFAFSVTLIANATYEQDDFMSVYES